jgi:hypothetical protein
LSGARLAAALGLLWACAAHATCDDPFGDPSEVLDFHLRLTLAEWDAMRLEKNPGLRCDLQYQWRQVEFRCGETDPWLVIGARHKRGDQRGVDAPQKPPLKLDFNHFVAGQRWPASLGDLGFRKFTLNNGQANLAGGVLPALLAEPVAWRLMQREVPLAPRSAYARLFVHFTDDEHVEYRGLYFLVEDLDRTAIRRREGHACGALLKSTVGWCREDPEYDDGPPNEARGLYDAWYDAIPGSDWETRTRAAFDLDELFRQEAIKDVLGSGRDSPTGDLHNNYYRWEPRTGKARFYPWDLDWMFAVYPLEIKADTKLEAACSPIGLKTRCDPKLRPEYLRTVCSLLQGTLSSEHILSEWRAADALVRPLVRDEQDPVWGGVDPLDAQVRGSYEAVNLRTRDWIPARIESVRAQVEAAGIPCPSSCEEGAAQACGVGGCAGLRHCTGGTWGDCEVARGAEACNGADDDCDGVIDEGCALAKDVCPKAAPAPRRNLSSCACTTSGGLWLGLALLWLLRDCARTRADCHRVRD